MSRRSSRTLYVGNLPGDVRERDVEDLFYKYGPIVEIDLKIPPRPPGYAFVEFEDPRDAEDAIRGRDGCKYDGQRLRVSHHLNLLLFSSNYNIFCSAAYVSVYFVTILVCACLCMYRLNLHMVGEDHHQAIATAAIIVEVVAVVFQGALNFVVHLPSVFLPYASYFLLMKELLIHHSVVLVTGLPHSASWQDLKDHMRQAGDVCFSQVFRDYDGYGMRGIVDYTNYEDMKYAIRKLDDTLFRNQFSKGYIRVCHNGLSVLNFALRPYTDMASHLYTNTRWKSMIRGVAIPGASVGVHIIQEAEAQVAAIATVAGAGASLLGTSIFAVPYLDLVRGPFLLGVVLSQLVALFRDVASAPTWGLHVRDLMEYGAQIPASRLVVAVFCVVLELL
ncbi:hypothetical protein RJ639_002250 [Escallonia herrerae]|uniref:RRM domain-containing protein n=1 Tax=Escallonia herrerae TaxID=1293975 RepID=A0AA89BM86_9ASTE|nr:hypothetical protein RJ639_002250 [Escallonia herrerae]